MPLAREHHARVLVLDRDRDVRERLVVPQPDVERRPVPLDEVTITSIDATRRGSCWICARESGDAWKYDRTRGRRDFALPT
jgi:hypothetical protein